MAEAQRARPMEYYNPRPLILGICFCWGVAMGFCLFYFSPPKQMMGPAPSAAGQPEAPRAQISDQERRRVGEPTLVEVAPAPETSVQPPAFETMLLEPQLPVVSTEGGLTGRTARPLTWQNPRPYSDPAPAPRAQPAPAAPPPIPELMP